MTELWWVEGERVHTTLTMIGPILHLARVRVRYDYDDDTTHCMLEQFWFDGMGDGINQDLGKLLRATTRRLRK